MPFQFIRGVAGSLLDSLIGVVERLIEGAGDPDLREAIERDRTSLRHAHDRLLEAYAEIEVLGAEVISMREALAERDAQITLLRSTQERGDNGHGLWCQCPECKES